MLLPLPLLLLLCWVAAAENPSTCSSPGSQCSGIGRSVHWVIRASDLRETIKFYKHVLGMRVIRHEENDEPCPITCNGKPRTAWSKTMMGYATEDLAYSLEITYNYGGDNFSSPGEGLRAIHMYVPNVPMAQARALELGYETPSRGIAAPDGYPLVLLEQPADRVERFAAVEINVRNLPRSIAFWETLGMIQKPNITSDDTLAVVSYPNKNYPGVQLMLREFHAPFQVGHWDGRHAVAIPESMLRQVYHTMQRGGLVVHPLQELEEPLGLLVIAIVKDPDGHEVCLVSAETFDKAVAIAADWKEPNWNLRDKLHVDRLFPTHVTQ